MIRLSVIVPCLQRASFLPATIDSILSQDDPRVECIVIDGGSTDETISILQSYGKKIRWLSEPDRGQGDAIRKGWRLAVGDLLTWLNADDLWCSGTAATVIDFFDHHPHVDVLYGDCDKIDVAGRVRGPAHVRPWDFHYMLTACDYCITQPASFLRRSIVERVGGIDPNRLLIDIDLWLRIGLIGGNFYYRPGLLAYGRAYSEYDRLAIAQDLVVLIQNFFQRNDLPSEIRRLKRRSISNAYLRAVEYVRDSASRPRRWIFYYLIRSLLADPTNFNAVWQHIAPVFQRRFCSLLSFFTRNYL